MKTRPVMERTHRESVRGPYLNSSLERKIAPGRTAHGFLPERTPVEVNVPPAAVLPLPDARLGGGGGDRLPIQADLLHQADVGQHGHVAEQTDVRLDHRGRVPAADAAEVEVEAVERQAADELAVRLRFDTGQVGGAEVLVRRPVTGGDRFEKFL